MRINTQIKNLATINRSTSSVNFSRVEWYRDPNLRPKSHVEEEESASPWSQKNVLPCTVSLFREKSVRQKYDYIFLLHVASYEKTSRKKIFNLVGFLLQLMGAKTLSQNAASRNNT